MKQNKQLFFSHTWRPDSLGRNTHHRVFELVKKLRDCGWKTWFDEEDMKGNIDAAMAEGIDNADVVLVCLTETYCKKVNETAKNLRSRDNCLKEWTYANARNKLMIPIVMEPYLLDPTNWPAGIVSLYLGSTLYLDASKDDLDESVIFINKYLLKQGLQPNNNIKKIFCDIINNKNKFTPLSPNRKSPSPLSPNRKSPSPLSPNRKSLSPLSPNRKSLSPLSSNRKSIFPISPNRKCSSPISPNRKCSSPISPNRKCSSPISPYKQIISQLKPISSNLTYKIPQPPNKLNKSKFKSPRKQAHRPAPTLPTLPTLPTIILSNTISNIESNKIDINPLIVIQKKPGNFSNRKISEINVLSNYTPNINIKKSISTGNFLNLCI